MTRFFLIHTFVNMNKLLYSKVTPIGIIIVFFVEFHLPSVSTFLKNIQFVGFSNIELPTESN